MVENCGECNASELTAGDACPRLASKTQASVRYKVEGFMFSFRESGKDKAVFELLVILPSTN